MTANYRAGAARHRWPTGGCFGTTTATLAAGPGFSCRSAAIHAAETAVVNKVLDVATSTGEAALMTLPLVGMSGLVVGADIAPAMLRAASSRLAHRSFWTGRRLMDRRCSFSDGSFDAVICQLGLQFFPDPALGLAEFRRVLRPGRCAATCVISMADRAPMWGILCDVLSRFLPAQRHG